MVPPEPPTPEPAPAWKTERVLSKRADWNSTLIEGFRDASITDTAQGQRHWLPGPQKAIGGRVETQAYFGAEGELCAYDYSILVPSSTRLSDYYKGDPKNIVTQHHADQAGGYTGGVSVYPDGQITLRVKGGHELSLAGSHPYQYEAELPFGEIERDVRHNIRLEIFWHRTTGYARARLDFDPWQSLDSVPTWPIGEADGVPSTKIMYRHGWYPQGGHVLGNMDIYYGPLQLQRPA